MLLVTNTVVWVYLERHISMRKLRVDFEGSYHAGLQDDLFSHSKVKNTKLHLFIDTNVLLGDLGVVSTHADTTSPINLVVWVMRGSTHSSCYNSATWVMLIMVA